MKYLLTLILLITSYIGFGQISNYAVKIEPKYDTVKAIFLCSDTSSKTVGSITYTMGSAYAMKGYVAYTNPNPQVLSTIQYFTKNGHFTGRTYLDADKKPLSTSIVVFIVKDHE
jgi:amino acid transporter